jgi:HlyD family secretion protein
MLMKKIIIPIMVILITLIVAVWGMYNFIKNNDDTNLQETLNTPENIQSEETKIDEIRGTGNAEDTDKEDLLSKINGFIKSVNVEEDQYVKEGDVLVELDDSNAMLDLNRQTNTIAQTTYNLQTINNNIDNLQVKSNISGYINNCNIKVNDFVTANTTICTVKNPSDYIIVLEFPYFENNLISVGNTAQVLLLDSLVYLDATVRQVSASAYLNAAGARVYDIELLVTDPGYSLAGQRAKGIVQNPASTLESSNEGYFKERDELAIKAKVSGTVKQVNVYNGQYINNGDIVAVLENDDLIASKKTTEYTLNNLILQRAYSSDQILNYTIKAPCDGKLQGTLPTVNSSVMPGLKIVSVVPDKQMDIKIYVNETKIAKLHIGQKANVTFRALEETQTNPVIGTVNEIKSIPRVLDGVTEYPVIIRVDKTENMKPGMSTDVSIVLQ